MTDHNMIPRDSYADSLLLNITELKPGLTIEKDAYAEDLLYNMGDLKGMNILPCEKVTPGNRNMLK